MLLSIHRKLNCQVLIQHSEKKEELLIKIINSVSRSNIRSKIHKSAISIRQAGFVARTNSRNDAPQIQWHFLCKHFELATSSFMEAVTPELNDSPYELMLSVIMHAHL